MSEDILGGTETILLVDDELMVRDIAARALISVGYRVLEAVNGPEALRVAHDCKTKIDLLITDVVMPLMSGKELSYRLTELRPSLKTLYISGYTQNVILTEGILNAGVDLLTKPFTARDLLSRTRESLDGRKAKLDESRLV